MAIQMPAAPGFIDSEFGIETNTQKFESPLDKSTQRKKLAGSRWMLTVVLPPMTQAQAAAWKVFFMQCEGMANTFEGFDPDHRTPRGQAAFTPGTPIVDGAGQTGGVLYITGAPASITGYLLPGDYLQVNGMLLMVQAQVDTDSSGEAGVPVRPRLRRPPADGASVVFDRPYCEMILIDDNQAKWRGNKNKIINGLTFSAIETF